MTLTCHCPTDINHGLKGPQGWKCKAAYRTQASLPSSRCSTTLELFCPL